MILEPKFNGDLVYELKKIVGSNNVTATFIKLFLIIRRLVITSMYCTRLHAWWSTQSRLVTLSFFAGGGSDLRFNDGSDLT